jgi:hypothetical protein
MTVAGGLLPAQFVYDHRRMNEDTPLPPRSTFPAGARCAHHPAQAAERSCARCGNYMCSDCISGNALGLCLACASRIGASSAFPFDRDSYTLDGLLNLSLSRFKQHWLPFVLLTIGQISLAVLPGMIAAIANGHVLQPKPFSMADLPQEILTALFGGIAQLTASLLIVGYTLDVLETKPVDSARFFSRLRALPAQLAAMLLAYGSVALCALVCFVAFRLAGGLPALPQSLLVAGIVAMLQLGLLVHFGLGFLFMTYELAHDPETSALAALSSTWALVDGRRWAVGTTLFVASVLPIVGALACCVGVVAAVPLSGLLMGALFLALKQAPLADRIGSPEWPV